MMVSDDLREKIAAFDFESFYTRQKRLFLHTAMWVAFATLLYISYNIAYGLSAFNGLILTLRMTAANMLVFYLFFYVLFPSLLRKRISIIASSLVVAVPLLLALWLFTQYFFSVIYHNLGYEINSGELKGIISANAAQSLSEVASPQKMLSQAFIIISILSPFFFVKILFEITRLYAKTIAISHQKSQLEIHNINIEKDFLKAQLNPHFLFNTLNNLYSLSLNKDESAPNVILNLAETMSYTVYESNTETVLLQKEIEFIKNYVELEKLRYSKSRIIRFVFPEIEQCRDLRIAPLLTFPMIENAFKYGLKSKDDPFINCVISVENGVFTFHIENDVSTYGFQAGRGGIGLKNSRKRLQLLYPDSHCISIEQINNSFSVSLKINFKTDDN